MFPKSWRQHQLQGRLAISHLYWICTPCSQEPCQSMSVYMHPSVLMLPFNSPRQSQWVCTDSSHCSHISDEKNPCSSSSLFTEKHVLEFGCGTSERVSLCERSSAPTQQLSALTSSTKFQPVIDPVPEFSPTAPFCTTCGVNTRRKN